MRKRMLVQLLLCSLLVLSFAAGMQAQATRTWVSGVGDDVNPCSRTAPCKTFAGAISKTAANGEISVLDPGGYGAVTITKGITIDGVGTQASILASLTTGITINAPTTATVTLRNLNINGAATGTRGIRIVQAKAVIIENCAIFGFRGSPGRGIDINLATGLTTNVFVNGTSITDNIGAAIAIAPTSGQPVVKLAVAGSQLNSNAAGLFAGEGSQVTLTRTTVSGNTILGIDGAGSIVPSQVHIDDSTIAFNPSGLQTAGGAAIRLSRSGIFSNPTRGFNILGGTISSYGDNYFGLNGANVGVLTNIAAQKQ